MDVQAEKLSLIEWIAKLNDPAVLEQFLAMRKAKEHRVVTTSGEEKKAIQEGIQAIEKGEVFSHEDIQEETRKRYPNLFK